MARSARSLRPCLAALVALAAIVPGSALAAAKPKPKPKPAPVRVAAPTPTAPAAGASVVAMPSFAWTAVAGADHYDFQLSSTVGFDAPVAGTTNFSTRNTNAAVDKTVPGGTYYWRVRAVPPTAVGRPSAWSSPRAFVKRWDLAPTLTSPADGAAVAAVTGGVTLRWAPVAYAYKYSVRIARDPGMASLVDTTTFPVLTQGTAFSYGGSLSPGTYYWDVTPLDAQDNPGTPSARRSFVYTWDSRTTPSVVDISSDPSTFQPRFSWSAVSGAARYEVEINTSSSFAAGSRVTCDCATTDTSYVPTGAVNDNTYYWRVRAVDASGNAGVWNVGSPYTKDFSGAVTGLHMTGTDADGNAANGFQTTTPVVSWNPTPGAAAYQVEVTRFLGGGCTAYDAPDEWRVVTAATSWTPLASAFPVAKPYHPDSATTLTTRSDGFGMANGSQYCVSVQALQNGDTGPTATLSGTGGNAWAFEYSGTDPCASSGTLAPPGSASAWVPANGYTAAQGGYGGRLPLFTWTPVSGAHAYWVLVARDSRFSNLVDYALVNQTAYAPRDTVDPVTYTDESSSYYWLVIPAPNCDGRGTWSLGNPPTAASPQTFQKDSTPATLVATASTVTGQPTLRWSAVEGAPNYHVQVATDAAFSNVVDDVTTPNTAYTPVTALPSGAVYWRVQALDALGIGLQWAPAATFAESRPAPTLTGGFGTTDGIIPWTWAAVPGAVSYDLQFTQPDGGLKSYGPYSQTAISLVLAEGTGTTLWQIRARFPKLDGDTVPGPWSAAGAWQRTITEPLAPTMSYRPGQLLLTWSPKDGAKQYHVQVATSADFSPGSMLDEATIDTTSFAPLLERDEYRLGGTFYWRVQAVDGSGNVGGYTVAQAIHVERRLRLSSNTHPVRARRTTVAVTVLNALNRPVKGASVTLGAGLGVKRVTARTGADGVARFRILPRSRGKLVYTATATGFVSGSLTLLVT